MQLPDIAAGHVVWVVGDTVYSWNQSATVCVWRPSSDAGWIEFDAFTCDVPDYRDLTLDEVDERVRAWHQYAIETDGRYSGRHPRTALLYGLSHWVRSGEVAG